MGTISVPDLPILLEPLARFEAVEKEGMSYKITYPINAYSARMAKPQREFGSCMERRNGKDGGGGNKQDR